MDARVIEMNEEEKNTFAYKMLVDIYKIIMQ